MFILRVFFLLYFVGNSIGKPLSNKTDHNGLVTRFDDLISRFKREFSEIIEEDRSKMKAVKAVFPKVPKDEIKNFNILLKHLGLSDEIVLIRPVEVVKDERFYMHSSKVSLQENGRVAVHDSTQAHTYVLGVNVYQHGTTRFKLKLESFQNNHWILVGIVKADVVPKGQRSYNWAGAYGWALGNDGQLHEDGSYKGSGHSWKKLSKQGG